MHSTTSTDTASSFNGEELYDMMGHATAKSRQIRVAIVGAGFAGLRCADELLTHGCHVTIFEARNRLGGRVAQSDHLGHTVDLGPNWIHGTNNNPIDLIAKSTGTHLYTWDEGQVLYGADRKPLPAEEVEEYGRLLWDDGIIAEAFDYSTENLDSIDSNRSLYDFFVDKSHKLFLDQPEDVARRKRETLLQVATFWGAYIGAHVSKQSLKWFWLEKCIDGENPFVSGTYTKILEQVAKHAQEQATIHLNTRVQSIVTDPDQEHTQPRIQLTSDPDTLHAFDEVVVTGPLGWLHNNLETFFNPPPPPRLTAAITNIGYGNLDKIYITFPRAFWNPLPPFTHFLPSPTDPWDLQAMNLSLLPSENPPTLLFYIYGDCANHIGKLVSTSSSSPSDRDAKLIAFLQPYITALPNYAPSNPDCIPTGVLATAWSADELAGYGSYSNFQVGLEDGKEDILTMRKGMPERGVWIAGEHTAPFVALGTASGAYQSGEEVAVRIVEAYGLVGKV